MMTATVEIAATLLEVTDPRTAMQAAAESLRDAIGCDQVAIRPLRRERGRWTRHQRLVHTNPPGVDPLLLEEHLTPSELSRVDDRVGEIVAAGDVAHWCDVLPADLLARVSRSSGYHESLSAPVSLGGGLWGVLSIASRDAVRRFTRGEVEALVQTAQLFSAALRRSEANDELRHRDAIMKAVARVATDVRAPGDPNETCRRLVGELAAATGRPIVSFCRTSPGKRMMEIVALHGDIDPSRATVEDWELFAEINDAYRAGRHVVLRSEDLTAAQRCVLRKAGTTAESLLGTPIIVGGRLWGHIVVADEPDARPYSDAEIEAIRIAAGLVATAATRASAEAALRESESMLLQSQKLEAIGLLAGGVAHDFSNTLMVVRGFAALIDDTSQEEETRSYAAHILDVAERSSGLLRRLLDLARKDGQQPVVSNVEETLVSLQALLEGIVPRSIALTVDAAPDTPLVTIDGGELEQVVLNLVLNACDALPDGGTIAISSSSDEEGALVLVVEDSGTGIAPDVLEHIFDPFFTTKASAHGSGIGLTVVQGIVTRAGGTIVARSTVGAGSTFTVSLPAADTPGTAAAGRPRAPVTRPLPVSRERVLLVEDDDRLRPALEKLLGRRGYDVVAAASGEQALGILAHHHGRFDALVSDVVMPGMDGHRLASDARSLHPDLAVVLMSGYALDLDPSLSGASFVPKHQDCSDLLDAVESALAARAA